MLPSLKQARKAVWNNIDAQGRRIMEQAFPGFSKPDGPNSIVKRVREDEMLVEFKNGSFWQLMGGDNFDSNVGANPVGIVLSEYSIMDPKSWEFMSPILMENGGWAWFIYTPRGPNHGLRLLENARQTPGWFSEVVTIETAGHLDVEAVVAEERLSGKAEELIRQEYFCDFNVGNVGSVFFNEFEKIDTGGRITEVPYDPNFPVETAWDIGKRDATAIWFIQKVGAQTRVIDYVEGTGKTVDYWAGVVHARGYPYIRHVGPHDLEHGDWAFAYGLTRKDIAGNFGINFEVAPKLSIEDGINASRSMLAKSIFDRVKTEDGVKALRHYRWGYDDEKDVFTSTPVHDWASHGASAYRYHSVMPEAIQQVAPWMKELLAGRATVNTANTMGWQGSGPQREYSDPLGDWRGGR
jgi:phage terminase large subunit